MYLFRIGKVVYQTLHRIVRAGAKGLTGATFRL